MITFGFAIYSFPRILARNQPYYYFIGPHLLALIVVVIPAPLEGVAERVFTTARPVFVTGFFKTGLGAIQNVSALFLPLSDDGMHVNMMVGTRVAYLDAPAAGHSWNGAHLKIGEKIDVDRPADLEKCCLLWESGRFGGPHGE